MFRGPFHQGNNDGIAKLFVGSCIGDNNFERIGKAHDSCTLAWRQAAGIAVFSLENKNFGTILVVAGRQGSGNIARSGYRASKAVAFGTVFCGIALQVGPEIVGKRIFGKYASLGIRKPSIVHVLFRTVLWMKNIPQPFLACRRHAHIIPGKVCFVGEACYQDALPVLGNKMFSVQNLVGDMIAKFLFKSFPDYCKGMAFVVGNKIFDIFK